MSRTLDYGKIYGFVDTKCAEYDSASEETEEGCNERTKTCQKYMIGDYCVSSASENIRQEIFNYGPVIVTIPVYRDFLVYKSGLYQVYPKNQRFSAEHAVKIIGWDVVDGKNCWVIENSWGEDWGRNGTAYTLYYVDAYWPSLRNCTSKGSPWQLPSTPKRQRTLRSQARKCSKKNLILAKNKHKEKLKSSFDHILTSLPHIT